MAKFPDDRTFSKYNNPQQGFVRNSSSENFDNNRNEPRAPITQQLPREKNDLHNREDKIKKQYAPMPKHNYANETIPEESFNQRSESGSKNKRAPLNDNMNQDSIVIPTMDGRKKKNDPFNHDSQYNGPTEIGGSGGSGYLNAENLHPKYKEKADPLVPFFGEELVRGLFSSNWNYRNEALMALKEEILRGSKSELLNWDDQAGLYTALFGTFSLLVEDKIATVVTTTFDVLITMLERMPPPPVGNHAMFRSYADDLIVGIISRMKLNDANLKSNQHPIEFDCLERLWEEKNIGPPNVCSFLYRMKGLPKTARMKMLAHLIKTFGVDSGNVPLEHVVTFATKNLEHANQEVRQSASDVIYEAFKIVGLDKIDHLLNEVRPNIRDQLINRFNDYLGVGEDEEVRGQMENNRKRGNSAKHKEKSTAEDLSKIWQFWGRKDPNLMNHAKNDQHLVKECPMLWTWVEWNQVVCIQDYNSHLLDGCEESNYQQWPRWKQAVHGDEYEDHIQNLTWAPAKPPHISQRWVLCKQDIAPGEEGLKLHYLRDGCPNNERTL